MSWSAGPMVDPTPDPTPEDLARREAVERRLVEEFEETEKIGESARWRPGRTDARGIDHSTYHDLLAPFATTTAAQNEAFLASMDAGLARRARRKTPLPQSGASASERREEDHGTDR